MKRMLQAATTALVLALAALPARATEDDGFVMGAGGWTCAEIVTSIDTDNKGEIQQISGWILGYWTAATFARETGFVDIVEHVGGRAIFDQTIEKCRTAPAGTMLYTVTQVLIANTK